MTAAQVWLPSYYILDPILQRDSLHKPQRSAENGDTAPIWLRTHSWALQAALALAAGTLYLLQFYVLISNAPTAFLAGRCSLTLPLDVLDVLASAQKPTLQREL